MATGGSKNLIWIARHGERLDMVDRNWKSSALADPNCSSDDTPLADRGRIQARELAQRLKRENIDHVFASPFQRCVETAHIVATELGKSVKLEPGICEVLWDFPPGYKSNEQLRELFDSVDLTYSPTLVPTKGEDYDSDCFGRVKDTVVPIRRRFQGSLLFVGHGASVAGMLHAFTGRGGYIGLCTLSCLEPKGDKWKGKFIGDAEHLSDKTNLRAY